MSRRADWALECFEQPKLTIRMFHGNAEMVVIGLYDGVG